METIKINYKDRYSKKEIEEKFIFNNSNLHFSEEYDEDTKYLSLEIFSKDDRDFQAISNLKDKLIYLREIDSNLDIKIEEAVFKIEINGQKHDYLLSKNINFNKHSDSELGLINGIDIIKLNVLFQEIKIIGENC